MVFLLALMLGVGTTVGVQNQEFFDQVAKEKAMGAEWHYVGKQPLDPTAKSIPGQICDPETGVCEEPFIVWKLKMPEDVVNETRE